MAYVYRHIRLDTNEVFYVGIGVQRLNKRAKTTVKRNTFWRNIVAKTDWYYEILFDDLTIEKAKEKEIEFIKIYGRKDLGNGTLCNLTDGGDGTLNYKVSDSVKNKLSIANKCKTLTLEHKEKISKSHKGKVFSEETISKMRLAKIGYKQSDETINKRAAKLIGNKSNSGKKLPEAVKLKMKEAQQKRRLREKLN